MRSWPASAAAGARAPGHLDVDGFIATLRHVHEGRHDVLVPRFHRHLEAAVAGAIRIPAGAPLVVVEGNYLLLERRVGGRAPPAGQMLAAPAPTTPYAGSGWWPGAGSTADRPMTPNTGWPPSTNPTPG